MDDESLKYSRVPEIFWCNIQRKYIWNILGIYLKSTSTMNICNADNNEQTQGTIPVKALDNIFANEETIQKKKVKLKYNCITQF